MMLIIIPRSTLQFQFFLGFNKCLWNILFSINNFLFHAQNISSLVVQRYRLSKYFNFVSVSIPYKTNTFYQILKVSHTLVCSVHYLDFLSVFFMKDCNFFIQKFDCFMLLLNFTTFRYSFFRGIIYCMAAVFSDIDDQFPGFGRYISST